MPPPPLPSSPPAALPEELIEEVLLRFPPGEPASLLRAALVCKRWRRLVSGPGFRRRFREFHRTPPMLGMLLHGAFVPTTAFRPRHAEHDGMRVVDARHGRVLFYAGARHGRVPFYGGRKYLVVWDPITDEEWKLHFPRVPPQYKASFNWDAAILCSAGGGCNHLDCHSQPFTVVLLRTVFGDAGAATVIWTYSSDAASWSEPTCSPQLSYQFNPWMRNVLVGNSLYFGTLSSRTALKYNLQLRQMSPIQLPPSMSLRRSTLLTTTKDGGLLLATEYDSKLIVWLRKDADDVDARWEQSRVSELKMLLPVDAEFTSLDVVGSTDDLAIIFLKADGVVYAMDLKTYEGKKVYEGRVQAIVPFMSFYTPELEAIYVGDGPNDEIGLSA